MFDRNVIDEHTSRTRTWGYESDGVTIREGEAREIRALSDATIAGKSLQALVASLNDREVPTITGKHQWSSADLRAALLQPKLAGLRIRHVEFITEDESPSVLDRGKWLSVRLTLDSPTRTRRGRPPTSLGTGIYICGYCSEARMQLRSVTGSGPTYKCANASKDSSRGHVARNADKLDTHVVGALLEVLSTPGTIDTLCQRSGINEDQERALQAERRTIRAKLNRLATIWDDDSIDDEQFILASRRLRARDAEIDEIVIAAGRISSLEVLRGPADIKRQWENSLTLEQQRAILCDVLTVTVLPSKGGGRARDGSYFDADAVRVELTTRAQHGMAGLPASVRDEIVTGSAD